MFSMMTDVDILNDKMTQRHEFQRFSKSELAFQKQKTKAKQNYMSNITPFNQCNFEHVDNFNILTIIIGQ